nr:coiled coil domain containing protein 39 [Hymenolepis microstoma]
MERLGQEVRKDNEERRDALHLWQKAVNRSESRSKEIESLLQSFEELDQRSDEILMNKKELEHFFANSIKDTAECRRKLEDSKKKLKALRLKSAATVDEMKITQSELLALKNIASRSCQNLQTLQLVVKESKSANSAQHEKINKTLENMEKLQMKLKDVQESKLSIDKLVAETELLLREEERYSNNLFKHIENLSRDRFHILKEKQTTHENKLRAESQIKACKSNIKALEEQISKMEEKVMHQDCILYAQDFKIIKLENRISKMEMDTSNAEELAIFQGKLTRLSAESEGLETLSRKLSKEVKDLKVESTRMERELTKFLNKKQSLDAQRDDDELCIDLTEKALMDLKKERNSILVDKSMLRLKLQRIDEKLGFFSKKVFNLEKYRLDMETCVKERELDINIALEMLTLQTRQADEEKSRLKKEISSKRLQLDKLMKRCEIESLKIKKTGDDESENQTYHLIEVLQEIDNLRSYGNKLNAEIEQSKCELEALQNTLLLVKEGNRLYENNYTEADQELIEERNEIEQVCKKWKKDLQEKKRYCLSLATDIQKKQLACETVYDDLLQTAMLKTELEGNKIKEEKDASLLKERIIRANKSLKKAKTAAIKQFPNMVGVDDEEIKEDIELQLMKDLVEKVAVLLMSQVKSTRVDQETKVIKARAYLRAADIITSPRSSSENPRAPVSGPSSAGTSVCSGTALAFLESPSTSTSQRVMNLSELVILPGESTSGRTSNLSNGSSKISGW